MFYIGQVIDVQSKSTATIKFLAPTKGRKDHGIYLLLLPPAFFMA